MSETYIICEGYHDRAFWAAWLERMGCTDPGHRDGAKRVDVFDQWKTKVARGQFLFHTPSGNHVRVVPVDGVDNVRQAARARLLEHSSKQLRRLVVNCDQHDLPRPHRYDDLLREMRFSVETDSDTRFRATMRDVPLELGILTWATPDEASPMLPSEETLERLVCAAIVAAYPSRGQAVLQWLSSRPGATPAKIKEYSWSHMAGWFAQRSCDSFFQAVWEDPRIAQQLEKRLKEAGRWDVVQQIVDE